MWGTLGWFAFLLILASLFGFIVALGIFFVLFCLVAVVWSDAGAYFAGRAWGKRKLAYLIQKQREGQYVLLDITMPAEAVKELERNIRFLEPVMRHMVTAV